MFSPLRNEDGAELDQRTTEKGNTGRNGEVTGASEEEYLISRY